MIFIYIITLVFLTVFSFGFIDANFPVKIFPWVFDFVHNNRQQATYLYVALMSSLFTFYLWVLRHDRNVWNLIFITVGILFISFPAFSYDIFNYIATAKVTYLYKENPYLVMPVEISGEPMLSFLHASNKVALYGPVWIALTVVPHVIGLGNLIWTMYAFKLLIVGFYFGLCFLIWQISEKNSRALIFFALNPLVITETLVSAHNDIVMMFLALFSFYLSMKNKWWMGLCMLALSVFVKGATIILLPLYFLRVPWKRVWVWAAVGLLVMFFLTPTREELYPWYFIWPLTFIALLPDKHFLKYLSHGFSFGLPLRFAPFIYYGDWGGAVPIIKKLVSSLSPAFSLLLYEAKKKR